MTTEVEELIRIKKLLKALVKVVFARLGCPDREPKE